jgi:hypothetical protein
MSTDILIRAAEVEGRIRGLLGRPRELSQAVRSVFDNRPNDGTILEYMNQKRLELHALFDSALGELRQVHEMARECVASGQQVPSLPALDKTLSDAERVRAGALDHWVEFDPNEKIDPNDEYISHEEFMKRLEDMMSPEARRELQSRLACEPN